MMDVRTLAIVGTAVAGPLILTEASHAGVPIPAFVTEAQRAACAQLQHQVLGVLPKDPRGVERTVPRFVEIRAAMVGLRGAADTAKLYALLSDEDVEALCTAFLAAVRAGVELDGGYRVTIAPDLAGVRVQSHVLDQLLAGDPPDFPTTSLGAAIARVVALKAQAVWGEVDPIAAQKTIAHLAVELDDVGYIVTGDPAQFDTIGVLESLGISGAWVASLPARGASALAGVVGDTLAGAIMSTPGLLLIGGYFVYRVYR